LHALIGLAERALETMYRRASVAFGEPIAKARIAIDQTRLLVLNAAWKMDTVGNRVAKKEIAMIKAAPEMACQVID
jgi:acyl-CoA dehydrogenase